MSASFILHPHTLIPSASTILSIGRYRSLTAYRLLFSGFGDAAEPL
jgi:hypothetical protein